MLGTYKNKQSLCPRAARAQTEGLYAKICLSKKNLIYATSGCGTMSDKAFQTPSAHRSPDDRNTV